MQSRLPPALREPNVFDQYLPNCESPTINRDEIECFKREKFLFKKGLIPTDVDLESIVNYVWQSVPNDVIRRNDASTWLDRPQDKWKPEYNTKFGPMHGGNWKFRSPHGFGSEAFISDKTTRHPSVMALVESMIGASVCSPTRVRGVYLILPKPPEVNGRLGPHVDTSAAKLSAMVFVPQRLLDVGDSRYDQAHTFSCTRCTRQFIAPM